MARAFYTYVWGGHRGRGAPLTFTSKQNRTVARRSTNVGDFVFGVVSRNPGDPAVQIADELKGRITSAWQISHQTADTIDYGIEATYAWEALPGGEYRWPFALQPIRTWTIRDAPEFRELNGYTASTHTQRAITSLQMVSEELGDTLMALLGSSGEELEVMTPRYLAMAARLVGLRQKHPYAVNGYVVQPNPEASYCIYIATLGRGTRLLKVGHAQNASARVAEFNKYRLSTEPQWVLDTDQPIGSVTDAIDVERHIGEVFAKYRTEPNNNEVYVDLEPIVVASQIAMAQRR